MKFFRYSCHQNPEKSFFIGRYQMPICSRCLGVYIGLIIGIVISAIFFKEVTAPIGFSLFGLMLLDWINQNMINLYFSNWSRLISGIAGGIALVILLTAFICFLI